MDAALGFVRYIFFCTFAALNMVVVAQLVRAIDCGSIGRGFEPHLPPLEKMLLYAAFFI